MLLLTQDNENNPVSAIDTNRKQHVTKTSSQKTEKN